MDVTVDPNKYRCPVIWDLRRRNMFQAFILVTVHWCLWSNAWQKSVLVTYVYVVVCENSYINGGNFFKQLK